MFNTTTATVRPKENHDDIFGNMSLIISVGFVLLVTFMLASGIFVRQEPWMTTAASPMSAKAIAHTNGNFVLAPKECVDSGMNVKAGCEQRVIVLPILP